MNSIIFRARYMKALSMLPPTRRLEAYDAIFAYAFTGEAVGVSETCAPIVTVICESIREDYERYEERKERAIRNGE